MKRIVCLNGNLLNENEVYISPFSRGLHYGDGVFETLRAYEGGFFRFESHVIRLIDGLKLLRIETCLNSSELCNTVKKVLHANNLSDACVKIIAFRSGPEGPSPLPGLKATIMVSAVPFDTKKKLLYEKGISGYFVSIRRNNHSPVASIKSLNYLDNILGRLEAGDNSADEALFLNVQGMVAEGATSNIFIIKHGAVITPPVKDGVLPGITRKAVLQTALDTGIQCLEQSFCREDVFDADEAFLTNSLMEIMPLVSVNGQPVGNGNPGKITGQFINKYVEQVKKELRCNYEDN